MPLIPSVRRKFRNFWNKSCIQNPPPKSGQT